MKRLEICNHLEIERIIPRFCPFCRNKLSKRRTAFLNCTCYYTFHKKSDHRVLWTRLFSEKRIRAFVCGTYKIIIDFCSCGSTSSNCRSFEIVIRDQKKLNNIPFLGEGFEFKS